MYKEGKRLIACHLVVSDDDRPFIVLTETKLNIWLFVIGRLVHTGLCVREMMLLIGTRFSNLYTAVHTPA
jgi:hypothetical protein